MNCPRCKKDFPIECIYFFKWLETAGLDVLQTAYIMGVIGRYGCLLCDECLDVLKNGFYTCGVNPYLKTKTEWQTPKSR